MALTTPSTSRCVRSGKSVHSCCTSSERIIGVPASGWIGPYSPKNTPRPLAIQAVRKVCSKQAGFARCLSKERRVSRDLALLLFRRFGGLGFFQGRAKDVPERGARIR